MHKKACLGEQFGEAFFGFFVDTRQYRLEGKGSIIDIDFLQKANKVEDIKKCGRVGFGSFEVNEFEQLFKDSSKSIHV